MGLSDRKDAPHPKARCALFAQTIARALGISKHT